MAKLGLMKFSCCLKQSHNNQGIKEKRKNLEKGVVVCEGQLPDCISEKKHQIVVEDLYFVQVPTLLAAKIAYKYIFTFLSSTKEQIVEPVPALLRQLLFRLTKEAYA